MLEITAAVLGEGVNLTAGVKTADDFIGAISIR